MKVFLTGASGFVGSRVLDELLSHHHDVTALVRKQEVAHKLSARGVKTLVGDLSSLDKIAQASKAADAVLHLAFDHDIKGATDYERSLKLDISVTETILATLAEGNVSLCIGCFNMST